MSTNPVNFTTPVGRLVQGSLYKANDKDNEGRPLIIKNGPNAGKPRQEWYVALAIPKARDAAGQVQHWAATDWGSKLWQVGHAFMASAGQMPAFAWKVRDGDSTVPNKKGKKPADQQGFPGCWVVSFASDFPPNCYSLIGSQNPTALPQPDAINLGDFVQINANVVSNGSTQQPGIFINMSMVCLIGYGERIFVGPDVESAGFGGQPLPQGASMTPLAAPPSALPSPTAAVAPAGYAPPPGAIGGAALPPVMPLPPIPGAVPGYAPPPVPGAAMPPQQPMAPPNPAILQPPVVPPVMAPPHVPPQRVMTPKAQGATYAQMIGAGWTDQQLLQHGMMLP